MTDCKLAACYEKLRLNGVGNNLVVSRKSNSTTSGGSIFLVDVTRSTATVNGTLIASEIQYPPESLGSVGDCLVVGADKTVVFDRRIDGPATSIVNRFSKFNVTTGDSADQSIFGESAGNLLKNDVNFITEPNSDSLILGTNAGHSLTGVSNTCIGSGAGSSITSATETVAVGTNALNSLTAAPGFSVAVGAYALASATSGENTAIGQSSMQNLTTGSLNTAIGEQSLLELLTGTNNVAIGRLAAQNIQGSSNVAVGAGSMANGGICNDNVAIGRDSLFSNAGDTNIAVGRGTLSGIATGSRNIAIGNLSGSALTLNDSDNILIGSVGVSGENNITRIGPASTECYIGGIDGVTTGGAAVAVLVDANGQLGTISSSRRYKRNIEAVDDIGFLSNLEVCKFKYKTSDEVQYGLIAEDVVGVCDDLVVVRDGVVETVQYHKLVPLLLKYCQKLERLISNT